ncbi:TPA: flagellar biosynthesis protein FliT, partial [Escherichia coli]|nr:flagellar biosynthesis protein FliT [Escherichia coli]
RVVARRNTNAVHCSSDWVLNQRRGE